VLSRFHLCEFTPVAMFTKPQKFVCVALACASVGQAVRRDFRVDRPAAVVDGLSALLQKHVSPAGVESAMQILQKAQKAVAGITPGAKDAMNAALESVITEIEQNVQSKIIQQFGETQVAIDAALSSLSTTTDVLVRSKATADTADNTFVACRETEKSRLQALESAQAALVAAREAKVAPCAEQDAAAPYSKAFAEEDLVFECDISVAGNCDGPLAAFEQQVEGLLSELETDVTAKTQIYTDAKGRCDSAKAAIVAAEGAQAQATAEFQNQREQCLRDHENRQVNLCVFGLDLTGKCSSRSAFEALNAQIDGSTNIRSESERTAEWEATSVTMCMLQLIVAADDLVNVNLNEQSIEGCSREVNYGRDVGVLDRKVSEFNAQVTADRFTCSETEIPFSGFNWVVPVATEDTVVTSSQYNKVAFSVPVNTRDGAKFDFCVVEGQTCGFFVCPFGKVIDASRTCALSTGCTAAECCPQ